MPRLLYRNFDFEHELAESSYNRPKRLARLNAELAPHLLALAKPGDTIWLPESLPAGFLNQMVDLGFPEVVALGPESAPPINTEFDFTPWGWSAAAEKFARTQTLRTQTSPVWRLPSRLTELLVATRIANSRGFSAGLEHGLGIGLPGACAVSSLEELQNAISSAATTGAAPTEQHWFVKADFGMSARERVAGAGLDIATSVENWLERRFKREQTLYFEPVVEPIIEVSTHWQVDATPDGRCATSRCVGVTELINDSAGQFLASRVIPLEQFEAGADNLSRDAVSQILAATSEAVSQLASLGYCGPVGIDSMIYRGPGGQPLVRPIQDINARWSMGRIACELQQRFAPDHETIWSLASYDLDTSLPTRLTMNRNWQQFATSPTEIAGRRCQRVGILHIQT
jgi:hypothetical protein